MNNSCSSIDDSRGEQQASGAKALAFFPRGSLFLGFFRRAGPPPPHARAGWCNAVSSSQFEGFLRAAERAHHSSHPSIPNRNSKEVINSNNGRSDEHRPPAANFLSDKEEKHVKEGIIVLQSQESSAGEPDTRGVWQLDAAALRLSAAAVARSHCLCWLADLILSPPCEPQENKGGGGLTGIQPSLAAGRGSGWCYCWCSVGTRPPFLLQPGPSRSLFAPTIFPRDDGCDLGIPSNHPSKIMRKKRQPHPQILLTGAAAGAHRGNDQRNKGKQRLVLPGGSSSHRTGITEKSRRSQQVDPILLRFQSNPPNRSKRNFRADWWPSNRR